MKRVSPRTSFMQIKKIHMQENTTSKITKIYTLLCVLFPVTSIYLSPIPGVELGTFLTLGFCVYLFFSHTKIKTKYPNLLWAVLLYIFLCTLITVAQSDTVYYSSLSSIINRTFRFEIIIIVLIAIGIPSFFNKDFFIKSLYVSSLIVAGYAILQSVWFALTSTKLMNTFAPTKQGVVFSTYLGEYEHVYRPPSFFLEPAAAAYFLTPCLCYLLFSQTSISPRKRFIALAVLSLGIICTTSGQGLLVLLLCWLIWFIREFRSLHISSILCFLFSAYLVITNIDIKYAIMRVFGIDGNISAVEARSGGYDMIQTLDIHHLILGTGFGNYDETIYYSSFAELIFCVGIFGFVLILLMYIVSFVKGILFQRVLIVMSLVLMTGGGIFSANYLCLYLPLILYNDWNNTRQVSTKQQKYHVIDVK